MISGEMKVNKLIETYCGMVADAIDQQGVYPTPMLAHGEKLDVYAMAVDARLIIAKAFENCRRPEIVEQIVGLDTYTLGGQGTTLDSCVIIFHLRRGEPTRIGVLEYSWNGGEPITKPVDWENGYWTTQYAKLAAALTEAFAAKRVSE